MPLPMVHLAVAREYAKDKPELLHSPEFYLGSIAPDAIHMRKNSGKEDKDVTHLGKAMEGRFERIREFHAQLASKKGMSPFILGYCLHLLTDHYWDVMVYAVQRPKFNEAEIPHEERRGLYYNDVDQLDFVLFKNLPYRADVWELLERAQSSDMPDLLTAAEIEAWKQRTLHWYDSGESKHKGPIRFLKEAQLLEFIDDTASRLRDSFIDMREAL